jgi:hypothetical protein
MAVLLVSNAWNQTYGEKQYWYHYWRIGWYWFDPYLELIDQLEMKN